MADMPEICVAHLVRARNGLKPFLGFLESYARNRGGIGHDLLIIYKGFNSKADIAEYEKLLEEFPHETLSVRDFGFDVGPYFEAIHKFNYNYFCFLNSFSVLIDSDWLRKMHIHISNNGIGLVGATGSYESTYTNLISLKIKLPIHKQIPLLPQIYRIRRYFDPFPNYHIRTNAFMIPSSIMKSISRPRICTKTDAHRFESGKESLTRQIMKNNLEVLVVGRDGIGYRKEQWCRSNTFRQGDQENLLVADNQTRKFTDSDEKTRLSLSRATWGDFSCSQ